MESNSEDTAKMLEYQLLSQQFGQLQQQLQMLSQQFEELETLSTDLTSLKGQKDAKTFSSLGGGIFVETEIKESDSVLLSVGSNILVKKDKEEAIKIINKQKEELNKIKAHLENEINKLNLHLNSIK
jgi:prefoldin alpha subunit